ncbi:MAG: methyltransferase family protein [Candidatus Saccharicenans sp.]|uniref:methyltransferase family protein n=1 Tax=Candidatus Saccharicenans sp. TaxID=2819258 RepID=UPI004049C416
MMRQALDIKGLKFTVISRFVLIFAFLGLAFFLTAGTFNYWQAWVYIVIIFIPMLIFMLYMLKHDPEFLERRMRTREKRKQQKIFQLVGLAPFLLVYILPGLDKRFGWSKVPVGLSIAGLAMVLFGYLIILYVLFTNRYASRVVEVEKEQKVITTGAYSVVRHPMYTGTIFFYWVTPLALGSYWGMIFSVFIVIILIFRILDEEKELIEKLEGYRDYTQKVKHRLIPGLW